MRKIEFSERQIAFSLTRLWRRLQPLATDRMLLDVRPARGSRFGSPLVLSRVHWVRPELVAEVKFLTWTDDNLLRQVVYEALREDKPAAEVSLAKHSWYLGANIPGSPVFSCPTPAACCAIGSSARMSRRAVTRASYCREPRRSRPRL